MSWALSLVRASLRVIRAHRALVVFPIISGIASILVIVAVALPIADQHRLTPGSWLLIGFGYFLLSLISVFCTAALVHAANLALRGEPATVAAGLRGAAVRIDAIVVWALISCTVSLLLRALNSIRLGPLVEAVLGVAWQLTTYLVIPLIVVEGDSVRASLRRSRELLRRTWGTNARGSIGVSVILTVSGLLGVVVLGGIGVLTGSLAHDATAGFLISGITIAAWLVLLSVLGGTISALFRAALYRFAVEGTTVRQFREFDLSTVFN